MQRRREAALENSKEQNEYAYLTTIRTHAAGSASIEPSQNGIIGSLIKYGIVKTKAQARALIAMVVIVVGITIWVNRPSHAATTAPTMPSPTTQR
jgi:hypothetical protein